MLCKKISEEVMLVKGKQTAVICSALLIIPFLAGCSSGGDSTSTSQSDTNQPIAQEQIIGFGNYANYFVLLSKSGTASGPGIDQCH
jgi:hypothetical protein